MTRISDEAIARLRAAAEWPDLSGTRYEAIDLIGRGGMGAVYRARDLELDREVALKVLSTPLPEEASCARMRREAKILASLEHPGIVPVHDVGVLADGRIFYAMKLVRGERLDRALRAIPSLPDRLRLFDRICEAVAFAHDRGVVHRDLKPENVMVGPFGEVLVMDWGIAKLLDRSIGEEPCGGAARASGGAVTRTGAVLGTPGYMAPEQAGGESAAIGPRSDVYSLGAILHFLAAGTAPPPEGALARFGEDVPKPLQSILRQALAPDPDARYASASDLAADVTGFREGRRIAAHRENLLDRLLRLFLRYRVAVILIASYLLMRIVLLLVFRT